MGALEGRVAVVTGAGNGLGRSHAIAFAAEGAAVVVNDLDDVAADAVCREIQSAGGRAGPDVATLATVADGVSLVERAVAEFGRIDIVVNNAGVSRPRPIVELDDAHLDIHLGVHLRATVGTTRAALAAMARTGGGHIVNTVSGHGIEPAFPDSAAYATAKAAVVGFTRAAAIEGAPLGVSVNAISPVALTRMSEAYLSTVEGAAEQYDPAHVSRVVVRLVATTPPVVTGRVFRVDGPLVGEYRVSLSELVAFERVEEVLGA